MNIIYKVDENTRLAVPLKGSNYVIDYCKSSLNNDTNIVGINSYKGVTIIHIINEDGTIEPEGIEVQIYENQNNRTFFRWDNKIIYTNDFQYMTVDELIDKITNCKDKNEIKDSEILATFLKDNDNIGILDYLNTRWHVLFDQNLFGHSPDSDKNRILTLCVPNERLYLKSGWQHKIVLEPYDSDLKETYASNSYRFQNLASLIRSGQIQLVNKHNYLKNETEKIKKKQ